MPDSGDQPPAGRSDYERFRELLGPARTGKSEQTVKGTAHISARTIDDAGNVVYVDRDNQPHRLDGPAVERTDGTTEWRHHGTLHRDLGPAQETATGIRQWYLNGVLHRDDGPASIDPNGTTEWWVRGRRHRDDGPAVTYANLPREEWYRYGKRVRPPAP